jgi:hypothetical protein
VTSIRDEIHWPQLAVHDHCSMNWWTQAIGDDRDQPFHSSAVRHSACSA